MKKCSGKYGPHDLDEVGTVTMANGRETCRECRRITKRQAKRKARVKSYEREAEELMLRYKIRESEIKHDPKRDWDCRRLERRISRLHLMVSRIDRQMKSEIQ